MDNLNLNEWLLRSKFLSPPQLSLNIEEDIQSINNYHNPNLMDFNSGNNWLGTLDKYSPLAGGTLGLVSDVYGNLQSPEVNPLDMNASSKGDLLSRGNTFALQGGYKGQLGRTNTAGSALSSAGKGAAAGSVLGPLGSSIGGIAGGLFGGISSLLGNRKRKRREREAAQRTIDNFNATNSYLSQGAISDWKSNQLAYGGNLFLDGRPSRQEKRAKKNKRYGIIPEMLEADLGRIPIDPDGIKAGKTFAYGGILPMTQRVNELLLAKGNNLFAYGGQFDNGVTMFNTGGKHEHNPLGGIPVGMSAEGIPNLVEEGEVKWNDYIFSDRINTKGVEDVHLPKTLEGKTFAFAAENISKESEERPHDPISRRGLNDGLTKLMTLQEMIKSREEEESLSGNVFAKGGFMDNSKSNSQKETNTKSMKDQLLEAYRNVAGITNEVMLNNLIQHDVLESNLSPQGKYNFSNITASKNWKGAVHKGKDHDADGNKISASFRSYESVEDYVKDKLDLLSRLYDFNPEDSPEEFIAKLDGMNKNKNRWAVDKQYANKMLSMVGGDPKKMPSAYVSPQDSNTTKNSTASNTNRRVAPRFAGIQSGVPHPAYPEISRESQERLLALEEKKHTDRTEYNQRMMENDYKRSQQIQSQAGNDNLRYAPLIAQAGLLGNLLSESPDSLSLERISPTPINDRLSYNPIDSDYLANQIRQQGAAVNRGLIDSSGGNRGIAQAGLMASNRSTTEAIGNALFQGAEYNNAQRERTVGFNRETNSMNSQQDLMAQQFNAQAYAQEQMYNRESKAALNNAIRQTVAGIGTTLGQIGTENRFFGIAPIISGGYDSYGRYYDGQEKDKKYNRGGQLKFYKKRIK